MDAQMYYNTFAEERRQMKERHNDELTALYHSHVAEAKEETKHFIGLHTGEFEASMVLFGTCIFRDMLPAARRIRFEKDAIYIIDTDGREHDLMTSDDIKMSLPSWVNVQWFCRTGFVKKIDYKIV